MKCRQRKPKSSSKHIVIHPNVCCPPRVTLFVLIRETDWDVLWDLVPDVQFTKNFVTHRWQKFVDGPLCRKNKGAVISRTYWVPLTRAFPVITLVIVTILPIVGIFTVNLTSLFSYFDFYFFTLLSITLILAVEGLGWRLSPWQRWEILRLITRIDGLVIAAPSRTDDSSLIASLDIWLLTNDRSNLST